MIRSIDKALEALGINLDKLNGQIVISALILLIICFVAIKLILTITDRFLIRSKIDETMHSFIRGVLKYAMLFITILLVAATLGFNVTSLVAVFSVLGLAVSLAIQGALSNFAGGVLLLLTKPFKVGDYVLIDGVEGKISDIGLIHTQVITPENKVVFIPNGDVSGTTITNFTYEDKVKVTVKITASYDSPVQTVHKAIKEACDSVPEILAEPEPFINVIEYRDSSIEYMVRAWANAESDIYWRAYFALLEAIKDAFDNNGVEMSYNHLNVHMIDN